MGGNKLRKLEYIIPDAIASGADTLVSIGGVQSNHTRMVTATAAKIGMKCVVIQEKWVPHHDAVYDRVGNILMRRLMGADTRLVDDGFDIGIRKSWEGRDTVREGRRRQALRDPGRRLGAQVWRTGLCRFRRGGGQAGERTRFIFDYIIVCVVTGSTQAGMIVGFAAQDRADRVIGIDASGTLDQTRAQVRRIVDDTADLVSLGRSVRDDEIVIKADYAYPAYGVPPEATNDAIRLAARTEAMITDPVYEGKSMQGLVDLTQKDFFPESSRILYAHLGGAPAINGYYSYYFRDDGVGLGPDRVSAKLPADEAAIASKLDRYPPLFP